MSSLSKHVVIVGGGTAGWMTAAALAKLLPLSCTVELVESAEIGIVGVGEATLPHLRSFVQTLGLDEREFMAVTKATYKLGIEFCDFGKIGDRYLHPFGTFGRSVEGVPFHNYWLRARHEGRNDSLFDYSLANVMAAQCRFAHPSSDPASLLSTINYAYQFDATKFAPYLRTFSENLGVVRTEGRIVRVEKNGESGAVDALILESGERIAGDLFIDCSGFRSVLLGEAMGEAWEDWSPWLPCDRAVALPCTAIKGPIEPYTRATAMSAGWRWRIPLQHRVGNGYVYSSAHLSDQDATDAIVRAIEGEALADPRIIRFLAGRRRRCWVGNVVAIGLASGFLEPLESTSIYLVQAAILQLIELFPINGIEAADCEEFNRLIDNEYDRIRDFLILHYNSTTRDDSSFWNHVRTMDVPDSLSEKLELFKSRGRIASYSRGLFFEDSWLAVYYGQGVFPDRWDQRANAIDKDILTQALNTLRQDIDHNVAAMPGHSDVLAGVAA
jgi:tryptophan 7-halogenase